MNYIVMEFQTTDADATSVLTSVHSTREEAEQKYHLILSSAAVSQLPAHAAVLLTGDGRMLASQCYRHVEEVVGE